MDLRRFILILLLMMPLCAVSASAATPKSKMQPVKTVTYCSPGGEALKMQIHGRRAADTEQPVVLYIHGGGWNSGNEKTGFERRRIKPLIQNGIAVATINYRLAPKHTHPAHVKDAKCAVKYLRRYASKLGIHPGRIGVMGDSAGGHLAAMIGLTDASHGFEGGEHPGVSSSVKAVATFYGLFDLVNVEPSLAQLAIPPAFPSAEARASGSPIIYVDPSDPPFLIIHGKKDRFVNVAQSVKLAMALKQAGHEPLLSAVENADHGLVPKGGVPSPDNPTLDRLMTAFFLEHLKP